MADLNLNQIEEKLNSEFNESDRVIIFWYDEKKEFVEDIENLNLKNAKIHRLTHTNLFETKILLERKDKRSNYLIYAPFKKPEDRYNHLSDTIIYSKEFFADRASLLLVDLGIDFIYKSIIEKHIKFFNSKERTKRFYELEIDNYNEKNIEIALLSACVKSKIVNFEEIVRIVLTDNLSNNKYLNELSKYDLEEIFWKYCNINFSYRDEEPNLIKLSISLLLTYVKSQTDKIAPSLDKYILSKPGTVISFLDQMMNSNIYLESFRSISDEVYRIVDGDNIFKNYEIEKLINIDVFKNIDRYIINWIIDKLLDENLNMQINQLTIPKLCKNRQFKHFGDLYEDKYNVLINSYHIVTYKDFNSKENILDLVEEYDKNYYKIDTYYRKFYYSLDKVENIKVFENIQTLVENIYVNKYLDNISKQFSKKLEYSNLKKQYKLQKDFYKNFIKGKNERIIVIISDAFRYELGKELVERFKHNEKIEAKIMPQIGVIPTYTDLGMAALLPHEKIEMLDDYKVYVDKKPTRNLAERNHILQSYNSNSNSIQYDDLKKMKIENIREFFAGKNVIYIYHNQIDARGDKLNTEDEVFIACNEAMEEIETIIKRLTNSISATNFIITADHGFIYTRNKNKESDKIDKFFKEDDNTNKRFIVSNESYDVVGTKNFLISEVLDNYNDKRTITTPITSNVFKTKGGGQNFVHGGSSPQEVLIPVIEVKSVTGAVETEKVKISLISMISKINSLILDLDFIQQEPISSTIKQGTFKIKFIDEYGNLISNEEIYTAKSKSKDSSDRIFKLNFKFRNKRYQRHEKYYFTIVDAETDIEIYRKQVIIDIAF